MAAMAPGRWTPWLLAMALAALGPAAAVTVAGRAVVQEGTPGTDGPLQAPRGPAPPALLLVSSPAERKVAYARLAGDEAMGGILRPLVDSGLGGPCGLAYDAARSALYVADPPSRRILRYVLRVRRCAGHGCILDYGLELEGTELVVLQGVLSAWVAVDSTGSLYWTDQEARSVSRLDAGVLRRLVSGSLTAGDIVAVPQQELEALAAVAAPGGALRAAAEALYEAAASSQVATPAGVAADGTAVYWANQAQGLQRGSVAAGPAAPPLQAVPLTNATEAAYGVAGARGAVLFTDSERRLSAIGRIDGRVTTLAQGFGAPRGVVWDGDGTAFVADMGGSAIYALPCGSHVGGGRIHRVLDFHGPFGLALVRAADPAFGEALDSGAARTRAVAGLTLALAATLRPRSWP
mmetsp:Transcript_65673/g.211916  ORF Transcript_65673/g.211916 Transcript_65673/m.211916 type:complete len:407 (-) Transcript_65673:96-1316(-)